MPSFKGKDVGMKCNFEPETDNLDELMPIIAVHSEKSHNMKEVPPETVEKAKKAVKK
jgi:predicted small metal-binding protein